MKRHLTLLLLLALTFTACDCPFAEYGETPSEYYRRTGYDMLTADKLPGLWQCYYPMVVGDVEFKEVRIFSSGKADIIMENLGGSAYYAETFAWRYDGRYLTFTKGRTVSQFQVTGFLSPELYLRDSRGRYTWAYRLTEGCIK